MKVFFYELGSHLGPEVAQGEFWALVFRKGYSKWKDVELDVEYWDGNLQAGEDMLEKTVKLNEERQKKQKNHNSKYRYMVSPTLDDQSEESDSVFSNYLTNKDQMVGRTRVLYEGMTMIKNYTRQISSPLHFIVRLESQLGEQKTFITLHFI